MPWPPLVSAQLLRAVLGEHRPSWCWPCPLPLAPGHVLLTRPQLQPRTVGWGVCSSGEGKPAGAGGCTHLWVGSSWGTWGLFLLVCPPSRSSSHCPPLILGLAPKCSSLLPFSGEPKLGCWLPGALGWKGLTGLPWNPGHLGSFLRRLRAQVREQVRCFRALGALPGRGWAPRSGVWPQGSVRAAAPEEGAPGRPPSLLFLLEPKHTRFLLLSGAGPLGSRRWGEPQSGSPSAAPLVSRASPGLHPAGEQPGGPSPPRGPASSCTDCGGEIRLSPAFTLTRNDTGSS